MRRLKMNACGSSAERSATVLASENVAVIVSVVASPSVSVVVESVTTLASVETTENVPPSVFYSPIIVIDMFIVPSAENVSCICAEPRMTMAI